jgi:hypothetical protein
VAELHHADREYVFVAVILLPRPNTFLRVMSLPDCPVQFVARIAFSETDPLPSWLSPDLRRSLDRMVAVLSTRSHVVHAGRWLLFLYDVSIAGSPERCSRGAPPGNR